MNVFYNFTLKIEPKRLLSPFRKLEMSMMLLCMLGLFVFGQKKLKICNVKKSNFKWTKFTIKN